MPKLRQHRSGTPFSFRPTESILNEKLPRLCDLWGEERTRVISRVLQLTWDHQFLGVSFESAAEAEAKTDPINYRPSTFEDEVIIPDLMSWMNTSDRSSAICQAIDFAYNQEMERRGISQ